MNAARRVLLGLSAVLVAAVAYASPAAAAPAHVTTTAYMAVPALPDPLGCKPTPPTPTRPDQGIPHLFIDTPDTPATGDPFAPDSGVNLIDVYGLAGLHWYAYDLGCGADVTRDPEGVTSTAVANMLMSLPVIVIGATYALGNYAYDPSWLTTLDPVLTQVGKTVHENVFNKVAPIAFGVAGLLLLLGARRMQISAAIGTATLGLLAITLATLGGQYAVRTGHAADQVLLTGTTTISSAIGVGGGATDTSSSAVAPVVGTILYQQWLEGALGSATSPAAVKYGPALYGAQTYTWAEVKEMDADPARTEPITEAKQEAWSDAASAVKNMDPSAYRILAGHDGSARIGAVSMATLAVALVTPFLLLSFILIIISFLIFRLMLMFIGIFAVIMVMTRSWTLAKTLGVMVLAAILNATIFTAGVGIDIRLVGAIMGPDTDLSWFFKIVVAGVVSIAIWSMLKPFRKLLALAPGTDPVLAAMNSVSSPLDRAKRMVGGTAKAAVGSFIGNRAADAYEDHKEAREDDEATAEVRDRPGDPLADRGRDNWVIDQGADPGAYTTNPNHYVGPDQPVFAEPFALPVGDTTQPAQIGGPVNVFISLAPPTQIEGTPTPSTEVDDRAPVAAIGAAKDTTVHVTVDGEQIEGVLIDGNDRTFDGQMQMPHVDAVVDDDGEVVYPTYVPSTGTYTTTVDAGAGRNEASDA